jgi:elongation factor P--(R)-beta-lysine ligase
LARYRQSSIKENLLLRAKILQAIRSYFQQNGFLEIETPIRILSPAPELYIDAVPSGSWWLQTSPELSMKQLVAAGYSRIFQICKCFRGQERGKKHLPEFSMLEWYTADANYTDVMVQTEALIRSVVEAIGTTPFLIYQNRKIDISAPFQRISVREAFGKWAPISMENALAANCFDDIMVTNIEPNLGFPNPTFLFDYPAERGALARLKPEDSTLAERFELYMFGLELCNAFTELTDPKAQRKRFEEEEHRRREQKKTPYSMPEKFLDALGDMPNTAGNALGIDRLVMLFADTDRIDDVVAFVPKEL